MSKNYLAIYGWQMLDLWNYFIHLYIQGSEKISQAKGVMCLRSGNSFVEGCSRDLRKPGGGERLIWAPTKSD